MTKRRGGALCNHNIIVAQLLAAGACCCCDKVFLLGDEDGESFQPTKTPTATVIQEIMKNVSHDEFGELFA